MMNRRMIALLGAWVLAVAVPAVLPAFRARAAGFDPARLEPYPLPEWYARGIFTPKYVEDATAWLEKNPTSQYAPRVAMDLLMAGTVNNNNELADRMRGVLLLEHGGSGPGAYVLTQFKDGSDFARFMNRLALLRLQGPADDKLGEKLKTAAMQGLQKLGPDALIGEDELAVLLAAIGLETADPRLAEVVAQGLRKKRTIGHESLRVLDIAVNPALDRAEKVVGLSACDPFYTAAVQRYLMGRLSDAERAKPPVVKVAAGEALRRRNPAEALRLLQSHPAKDTDPQLMFWRVWGLAATGQRDQAAAVAKAAAEKFPRDPWAQRSGEWAAHLAAHDASLATHAAALFEATSFLREGATQLEVRLAFHPGGRGHGGHGGRGGDKVTLYLAFAAAKSFHLHVARAGQTVVAYRATPQRTSAWLAGDPAVQQVPGPGPMMAPRLTLRREANGSFQFSFDAQFSSDFEVVAAAYRSLLASPLLATRQGVHDFLKDNLSLPFVPVPPVEEGGSEVLTWLRPQLQDPHFRKLQFRISPDKRLAGVTAEMPEGAFVVESLSYGAAGAFELKPPQWPDLPAVQREKMDPGLLFKMLGSVMSMFQGHTADVTGRLGA